MTNLLFLGTPEDEPFLPRLKGIIKHTGSTYVVTKPVTTLIEVVMYCQKRGITGIICTQAALIPKLSGLTIDASGKKPKLPSLDNYAGSYFLHSGIEWVFMNPLKHLMTVSYGTFLAKRYISKLTNPESWYKATEFSWEVATASTLERLYQRFSAAQLIAVDIETIKDPLAITCIGYAAAWYDPATKSWSSHCISFPLDSEFNLAYMRKFNALQIPKITQNGKYDLAYLSRYNAPLACWYYDTATVMHSTYCELPKALDNLAAFFIREARYWKHESKVAINSEPYLLYNSKDVWNTLNVFMSWMLEAPQYAIDNYLMEFPLNYPCHLSEMTGLLVNEETFAINRATQEQKADMKLLSLRTMIASPGFNPGSPVQVAKLLKVLGCADLTSTDEKNLKKAGYRHALNNRVVKAILDVRKARKLISTYLVPEKLFKGVILYALDPHGTDSGRLASKEHHFWTGMQIQNMPRGPEVKSAIIPYDNFKLGEADYSQAESRGTGYITGEQNLINNVEGTRDFHSLNASAFFGVPYEEIFNDEEYLDEDGTLHKQGTINKDLRDLSKRTNHGANYNMGPDVMLETMGEENVAKAKKLLGLPKLWTLRQVCEHLLAVFARTYPKVKVDYQNWIVYQVLTYGKLVGATGWTRICFGNPSKSKLDLNSYIAHPPQSLNAMNLNKAYMRVFYEVWYKNQNNFKLCAQIHDSILFQYRIGYEHLAQEVKRCMEFDVPVTDIDGTTRNMLVPVDMKIDLDSWAKG